MPTTSDLPGQRVSYHNGILLDASDFQQEQAYHRGRLALALSRIHGFGTIAGLKVEHSPAGPVDPATGEPSPAEILRVQPGVALDRAGRLIEIPSAQCLRLARWLAHEVARPGANLKPFAGGGRREFVGDLFLGFQECPQGLRPDFPEPAADATDAVVASRTADAFALRLVPRDCDPADELPPVPASRFPTVPANRADVLAAIYAAYDPAAPREYPPGFDDPTAVFLSRIRIRLEDAAGSLRRHATAEVRIDDLDRPLVTSTDLLRPLLPS